MHRDAEPEKLATTSEALAEEDELKVSTTATEASIEEAEDTTRPSERLQQWRRRCVYGSHGIDNNDVGIDRVRRAR